MNYHVKYIKYKKKYFNLVLQNGGINKKSLEDDATLFNSLFNKLLLEDIGGV